MEDDKSIIEFDLADVVDDWIEAKFADLRVELRNILDQVGVRLVIDEETSLVDFESMEKYLEDNSNEQS